MRSITNRSILIRVFAVLCLLGAANNLAAEEADDPLQGINRPIYNFNDGLDRYVMRPIAEGYVAVTPKPVRTGVTNFFDNLTYLNVILNDILQAKFEQALNDMARMFINSTVGIGGLFDPASSVGLVKNNEDLGQTFGVWGAGEGAYLVLPLFGPNSVRDAPNLASSAALNPLTYFATAIAAPVTAVNLVNTRANLLDASRFVDDAALDPYAFTREAYRQHRTALIYDGNPPVEDLDNFFDEEDDAYLNDEPKLIIE
jgi:phospholipid-binding lipoprotein MlaA